MHRNDFNAIRHFAAEENKKAVEFYKQWIVEKCGGNVLKINEVWRAIDSYREEGTSPISGSAWRNAAVKVAALLEPAVLELPAASGRRYAT